MQLLYVYIGGYVTVDNNHYSEVSNEPYRTFKNVGLNFSNKYIFEYNEKSNILDVQENESYINNFFDDEGILKTITAVIGKNGSGKSSVIELIKWLQPDNIHNIPYKLILVYGNIESEITQKFTILKQAELDCVLGPKFENHVQIKNFQTNSYNNPSFELPSALEELIQINYSPIFEIKYSNVQGFHEFAGDSNIIDISTSHLLEKDAEDMINGPMYSLSSREVLIRHKMADVERQYLFSTFYKTIELNKELGFTVPSYLELIIDDHDYRVFSNLRLVKLTRNIFEKNKDSFNSTSKECFIYKVIENAFHNLIRYVFQNSLIPDSELLILKILKEINVSKGENLELIVLNFNKNIEINNNFLNNEIKIRTQFILNLFKVPVINFKGGSSATCRLNTIAEIDIINQYFSFKKITGFLLLDWQFNLHNNGQLSSGEKAKFNLFSRFHYILKKAQLQSKDLSNLLILIDEGDALLHPEWQRTFLNDLIKGLKMIFTTTKSIQIILTTHSPFVSSDLPWYSVIKLDKNESGVTEIKYKNDSPTFAANIHDLYADSFYMKNGFVGEFAVNKIRSLIEKINAVTVDNKEMLKKEINLIGEPFIRVSLTDKLLQKQSDE